MFSEYNKGSKPEFSFWRDKSGLEIDLLKNTFAENEKEVIDAYEIKSSETLSADYFKNLEKWGSLPGNSANFCFMLYTNFEFFDSDF